MSVSPAVLALSHSHLQLGLPLSSLNAFCVECKHTKPSTPQKQREGKAKGSRKQREKNSENEKRAALFLNSRSLTFRLALAFVRCHRAHTNMHTHIEREREREHLPLHCVKSSLHTLDFISLAHNTIVVLFDFLFVSDDVTYHKSYQKRNQMNQRKQRPLLIKISWEKKETKKGIFDRRRRKDKKK